MNTNIVLQQLWDQFDEDRDCYLTQSEIKACLKSVGVDLSAEQLEQVIVELRKEMDLWTEASETSAESDFYPDALMEAEGTANMRRSNAHVRLLVQLPAHVRESRLKFKAKAKLAHDAWEISQSKGIQSQSSVALELLDMGEEQFSVHFPPPSSHDHEMD